MSRTAPRVSVIVRSMDRPVLARALDCAAAQTWPELEIIVVAACGPAHRDLPETWQGRPLRFVRSAARLPRAEAANAGLDAATGDWINLLDDDDEWTADHVDHLVSFAAQGPERLVYATAEIRNERNEHAGFVGRPGTHMQLYYQNRWQPTATMFHRSLLADGVRFDPAFEILEDWDFAIQCARHTAFRWLPEVTCIWHAGAGESGCGVGANEDRAKHALFAGRVREKWRAQFEAWMQDPRELMFLGQRHLKEGDAATALELLETVLDALPTDLNALNLCAMANLHNNRLERAETLLLSADRLRPGVPAIAANLVLVRQRMQASSGSAR